MAHRDATRNGPLAGAALRPVRCLRGFQLLKARGVCSCSRLSAHCRRGLHIAPTTKLRWRDARASAGELWLVDLRQTQELGDCHGAQSAFLQAAQNQRQRCRSNAPMLSLTLVAVVHEHDIAWCDA